jgi:hypothetical protein
MGHTKNRLVNAANARVVFVDTPRLPLLFMLRALFEYLFVEIFVFKLPLFTHKLGNLSSISQTSGEIGVGVRGRRPIA